MANPAIWFWPTPNGGAVKIPFTEPFSDLQETFDDRSNSEGSENGDGIQQRIDYGGRLRLRIVYERFTSRLLAAKLRTLQVHLNKGYPIAVAADEDKAWAAYVEAFTIPAGRTGLQTRGNVFYVLNQVDNPLVNDYIVIRSQNPIGYSEEKQVKTWDPATFRIGFDSAEPTWYDHDEGPVFVRHSLFYPAMYLPIEEVNRPILTTDRQINWTLDLNLVEAPGDYAALYASTDGEGYMGNPEFQFGGLTGESRGVFESTGSGGGSSSAGDSGLNTLQELIGMGLTSDDGTTDPAAGSDYFGTRGRF